MKFLAASWRAAIAVDWNLTCIEWVPGTLGTYLVFLGKFPRLAFEKGTSLLNTQLIFGTCRFHARLPVWAYNGGAS